MSVMLANAQLGLRRRVDDTVRNAHGERVRAGWGQVIGFHDGRIREREDAVWSLGVDPSLWPVRAGDMVVSQAGEAWIVTGSSLITNSYDSVVDWVRVTAQRRSAGGTEPGGAWFVARYLDTVDPDVPDPNGEPVLSQPGLWTGYGPPPLGNWGADEGDEYIDLSTGTVYRLGDE